MDEENQNAEDPSDTAGEPEVKPEDSSSSNVNKSELSSARPSTSSTVNDGKNVLKPALTRNYRRRTGTDSSDDETNDNVNDVVQSESAVNLPNTETNQHSSDSEEMSLEEVHVSDSDGRANRDDRR